MTLPSSSIRNTTLVSVVILNHNSKETLEQCLNSVMRLDWPQLEVIVVDNASDDGSADFVDVTYGSRVRLIRRPINCPTAGRNDGFRAANGQFILSLDNDIVLVDSLVVKNSVELFDRFPPVGVLAFKIGAMGSSQEPLHEHWWYHRPIDTWKNRFFYADFFSEGAVFFRAEALRVTGGYDDEFFWGFESVDLSLRLLSEGFEMLYCPVLTCCESRVRGIQTKKRLIINYLSLRNRLWIVWKHYPLWRGLKYSSGRVAVAFIRSIRYGWVDHFIRGVKDGIVAPSSVRAQRKPLSEDVWKKIQDIRRGLFDSTLPLSAE